MHSLLRVGSRVAVGAVVWLAGSGLAAGQVPDKFTNLKVLSPEISKAELVETMKAFTRALGVRCSACHVGEEGKPLTTYDFPADEKQMKLNARVMLQMVHNINQERLPRLRLSGGEKPVTVTCYTCHRGQKQPETKAPVMPPPVVTPAAAGPPKPTT